MSKIYYIILSFALLLVVAKVSSQDIKFSKEALQETFLTLDDDTITFEKIIEKNLGSTVFIDIWASWCKDCIVGMPKLKMIMKAYPDMKFVYLSLDKNEDSWKKGIKKYKLSKGQHYFAPKGWKSDIFSSIDLDWIPRYMLLNKEGEIALFKAITLEDKELKNKLTSEQ